MTTRHSRAAMMIVLMLGLLPAAAFAEESPARDERPTVDHSALDKVLKKHVNATGWVDYAALAKDTTSLDAYITSMATIPFDQLSRDEQLATLINAYNAFTLSLIVEYFDDGKLESIRDIPEAKRWDHVRWNIAGKKYSLNQIEHEWIRKKFKEPRIHWALVCAAYSCPPLRNEAYTGKQLDKQLAAAEAYVHSDDRFYRQGRMGTIALTQLYKWYAKDFIDAAGSVTKYVGRSVPHVKMMVDADFEPPIEWIEYDWRLNDIANRPGNKK